MKQWLNAPVTYGYLIRISLVCFFLFSLFIAALVLALNIGGPHWTNLSAIGIAVIGAVIGLGQWLIHFPDPPEFTETPLFAHEITVDQAFELLKKQEERHLKTSSNRGTGTLLIPTGKENGGVTVYLLPRDDFFKSRKSAVERRNNKQLKRATVTGERFGSHLLFVSRFRDLQPGRYNVWIGADIDEPKSPVVEMHKGIVSELEPNWKKLFFN